MSSPSTSSGLAPITGSFALHLAIIPVQLLFLASPNFPYRHMLATATLIVLLVTASLRGPFTDSVSNAQSVSLLWPTTLSTIAHFYSSGKAGPEARLWKLSECNEKSAMHAFSLRKIHWAGSLMLAQRGVGWSFRVKNTPLPRAERQRWTFVRAQGTRTIYLILMTDLVLQLGIRLFWTRENGVMGGSSLGGDFSIRDDDWRWSLVKSGVFGLGPYFMMELHYTMAAILLVATGVNKAEDWPPLFGKLKDANTVRAFWGKFWHQCIRQSLTTLSNLVADIFSISHNTTLRKYFVLYLAFFISGVFHMNAMLLIPYHANLSLSERCFGVLQFFIWQACAIAFEDIVQWGWNRYHGGRSSFATILGYIWVMVNFWLSLPLAADVMMRLHLTERTFLPGTVVGPWMVYVPLPR